jgi:hypothetical protein
VPPVIALADGEQSYLAHQPRMHDPHVMLALPLTGSAMFNAVNAAVSTRPEGREHMLQFTESDVLRTQWLIGVRLLVVDDSALNREVAQGIFEKPGCNRQHLL